MSMQAREGEHTPAFAVINYVDLDDNMAKIASSGRITADDDYHLDGEIKKIQNAGYELVTNGFAQEKFDNEDHLVTFKHQREVATADNLVYGIKRADVVKEGRQVVHYQGAGNRTPRDNEATVELTRAIVFDKVTEKKIGSKPWQPVQTNYPVVGSPSVQGYAPIKEMIGGQAIDPDHPNVTYIVDYRLVDRPSTASQTAVIRFLDIDKQNQPAIEPVTVTGQPNTPIDYDPTAALDRLTRQGYELVDNEYNPAGTRQFFDADDGFDQTYIITLKHRHAQASVHQPQDGVDADQYQKTTKLTVEFTGAADQTPIPFVQTVKWTRTVTVDLVTGQIVTAGDWQAAEQTYDAVPIPVVDGFHTAEKTVPAHPLEDEDITLKVVYQPNGCIVPVNSQDRAIKEAAVPYRTDPDDPTRAAANQPLPKVPGYYTKEKTVTPEDVAADTPVQYLAALVHAPLAIVNYVDMGDEHRQLATSGLVQWEVDQPIAEVYSTASELAQLKKAGYQVVYNNLDHQQQTPVFRRNELQAFTIILVQADAMKKLNRDDGATGQGNDLTTIFNALRSLNSLVDMMMKNKNLPK